MSEKHQKGLATLAQLAEFDEIIDVRSPAEFEDDRLPGAINCPVLDNEERARVGTIYKQVSAFEAKKIGAAIVTRHIGEHIEARFLDKPRSWKPLVYCWRGGKRSGTFSYILREIGWDAHRLDGGYKSWRRHVVEALATLPQRFDYRVVSGATGNAKSRVLEALGEMGAQVLHLEQFAAHKGSVLGALPGTPQPAQRLFETRLYTALNGFDPARPVYVEAESRRIGLLHLPDALIGAIRAAPCLRIEADTAARVDFLLRDYDYFLATPSLLTDKIVHLQGLQSNETIERWQAMANAGEFRALFGELLEHHYDPLYQKSQGKNYVGYAAAPCFATDDLSEAGIRQLAAAILAN
ncbi:MAG: tRNA 2-selenouridine(34) synthase MnmH [Gammaproteobacteria bacterium]|nr:tRNA 2-selenouridine(34) synthase MnmH [Gammaproteobacteria bacterium]MBU1645451.1 tRNA 2-selenouridine(34) synthase MnmH [Gammaproteobacteria bacterium]MBU1971074.1 tRNA 2-selenouridine(34) synthase MnmH [Gammaproteobacteria bacterium]